MSALGEHPREGGLERRLAHFLDVTLGTVLAVLVFAMMALTFVDVFGRQAFNAPVPAGFEVTEVMMGFTVYLGLPIVCARQDHIAIGLLDGLFRGAARRIQKVLVNLLAGALGLFWTREMWIQAEALDEANELMMFLQIETGVFVYGMAALTLAAAAILLFLAAVAAVGPADADGGKAG